MISAKSYKTKFVEPIIKKLREVIEAVFALYYQALDSYHRLNMTNEEMLGCKGVLTKAPVYAVERINAIKKVGFTKSDNYLIGKTGYKYDGYWTIN